MTAPATAEVGQSVTVDASTSTNPTTGLHATFRIASQPQGSQSAIRPTSGLTGAFIPDREGTYVIAATVANDLRAAPSELVTVTVSGSCFTVASAVTDAQASQHQNLVTISPSCATALSWHWALSSAPSGSEARISPTATDPSLTPDRAGTFELRYSISDGDTPLALSGAVSVTVGDGCAPTARIRLSKSVINTAEDAIVDLNTSTTACGHTVAKVSWRTSGPADTQVSVSSQLPGGGYIAPAQPGMYTVVGELTDSAGLRSTATATFLMVDDLTPSGGEFSFVLVGDEPWVAYTEQDTHNLMLAELDGTTGLWARQIAYAAGTATITDPTLQVYLGQPGISFVENSGAAHVLRLASQSATGIWSVQTIAAAVTPPGSFPQNSYPYFPIDTLPTAEFALDSAGRPSFVFAAPDTVNAGQTIYRYAYCASLSACSATSVNIFSVIVGYEHRLAFAPGDMPFIVGKADDVTYTTYLALCGDRTCASLDDTLEVVPFGKAANSSIDFAFAFDPQGNAHVIYQDLITHVPTHASCAVADCQLDSSGWPSTSLLISGTMLAPSIGFTLSGALRLAWTDTGTVFYAALDSGATHARQVGNTDSSKPVLQMTSQGQPRILYRTNDQHLLLWQDTD